MYGIHANILTNILRLYAVRYIRTYEGQATQVGGPKKDW